MKNGVLMVFLLLPVRATCISSRPFSACTFFICHCHRSHASVPILRESQETPAEKKMLGYLALSLALVGSAESFIPVVSMSCEHDMTLQIL